MSCDNQPVKLCRLVTQMNPARTRLNKVVSRAWLSASRHHCFSKKVLGSDLGAFWVHFTCYLLGLPLNTCRYFEFEQELCRFTLGKEKPQKKTV